ncbi:hypothetical protein OXX69_013064, partial [Metschnikowia pulcherrima]
PFKMKCGTRQGNPLSPLIFNLALEPLLFRLQRLRGITVKYSGVELAIMKHHAFADDVNIYLGNRSDYAIAASVIENFEKISNSKVNPRKSQLLGFHPDFADHFQHELPYTQTYVRNKDLKYLGLPLKGVDWSAVRAKLPFISFKRGYSQLDVITKAKATNMYVSSTLVYKDLVQCMSKKEIKAMDDAIQRVFYGIGRDKLYARPKKGGVWSHRTCGSIARTQSSGTSKYLVGCN